MWQITKEFRISRSAQYQNQYLPHASVPVPKASDSALHFAIFPCGWVGVWELCNGLKRRVIKKSKTSGTAGPQPLGKCNLSANHTLWQSCSNRFQPLPILLQTAINIWLMHACDLQYTGYAHLPVEMCCLSCLICGPLLFVECLKIME
jgi:hypothetical protein